MTDTISWPSKRDLFGVQVSRAAYADAADAIMAAAHRHASAVVTHLPVHGLVTAAMNPTYRQRVNQFDLIAADGQPVRWAMNLFHKAGLEDRLYGPELMLRLCRRAAKEGVSVYLYGSTPDVIDGLCNKLARECAGLQIVGCEAPPFRALSKEEDDAVVRRINESGAGLVFLGLGLPKQDHFAFEHKDRIKAVQLCVGAAFDFHAGNKKMAPSWMQKRGLEWAYRLVQEPGRLWKRYLTTNLMFLGLVGLRVIKGR